MSAPTPARTAVPFAHQARRGGLLGTGAYLMATTVVTASLGYLYWVLAAHLYMPAQLGQVSALVSGIALAANLAGIGVGATLIVRLPVRTSASEWWTTLLAAAAGATTIALLGGLLLAVGLSVLATRLGLHLGALLSLALVAGVPIWTLAALLDAVLLAEQSARRMLARNAVASLAKIPLMALPALVGTHQMLVLLLSWHLATVLSMGAGRPLFRARPFPARPPTLGQLLAEGWRLCRACGGHQLIGLGGMAWMYLLPVVVGLRRSASDNAYSTLTWLAASLLFMVSSAVATALFTEGARGGRGLASRAGRALALVLAVLGPIQVGYLLVGGPVLALFGPAYPRHCAGLMIILVIAALPDAVTNLYVAVLRVRRQLALAALVNIGMVALALALAWLWLPPRGIEGAGLAWLVAQGVGSLVALAHLLLHSVVPRLRRATKGGVSSGDHVAQALADALGQVSRAGRVRQ